MMNIPANMKNMNSYTNQNTLLCILCTVPLAVVLVSNTHLSHPYSSISTHHLNPTNTLITIHIIPTTYILNYPEIYCTNHHNDLIQNHPREVWCEDVEYQDCKFEYHTQYTNYRVGWFIHINICTLEQFIIGKCHQVHIVWNLEPILFLLIPILLCWLQWLILSVHRFSHSSILQLHPRWS